MTWNRNILRKIAIFAVDLETIKTKMQQNRMNITATEVCRGSKRFEGVLYAPISSISTFDIFRNTIQLKYTQTRIL